MSAVEFKRAINDPAFGSVARYDLTGHIHPRKPQGRLLVYPNSSQIIIHRHETAKNFLKWLSKNLPDDKSEIRFSVIDDSNFEYNRELSSTKEKLDFVLEWMKKADKALFFRVDSSSFSASFEERFKVGHVILLVENKDFDEELYSSFVSELGWETMPDAGAQIQQIRLRYQS